MTRLSRILLGFGLSLPFYLTGATMLAVTDPSVWPFLLIVVGEALRRACWFGLRGESVSRPMPKPQVSRAPSIPPVRPRIIHRTPKASAPVRRSSEVVTVVENRPVRTGSFTTIDEIMQREG